MLLWPGRPHPLRDCGEDPGRCRNTERLPGPRRNWCQALPLGNAVARVPSRYGRNQCRGRRRQGLGGNIQRGPRERFVYAEDATLQGIYLKLRLLAETESLSGNLEDGPRLLWPRIILTILRDLKALGSLQEPTGEF